MNLLRHYVGHTLWCTKRLAAVLYGYGSHTLTVVDDDEERRFVLHHLLLKIVLQRHVYRVGNLHQDNVGVALQMVDAMVEHPVVRQALRLLFLRRCALAEDNVAVLGKERRQMFLSVLPFVWGQFSVIFKIIRSKFCHCQINILLG